MDAGLIERLAREAWGELGVCLNLPQVERFATLIAEECAKVCEARERAWVGHAEANGAAYCATTIRAVFTA